MAQYVTNIMTQKIAYQKIKIKNVVKYGEDEPISTGLEKVAIRAIMADRIDITQ
jgi:hypothetical protein